MILIADIEVNKQLKPIVAELFTREEEKLNVSVIFISQSYFAADNNILNTDVVVSLKYLSNLWGFLDLPHINCEIELDLTWSKNCIIS